MLLYTRLQPARAGSRWQSRVLPASRWQCGEGWGWWAEGQKNEPSCPGERGEVWRWPLICKNPQGWTWRMGPGHSLSNITIASDAAFLSFGVLSVEGGETYLFLKGWREIKKIKVCMMLSSPHPAQVLDSSSSYYVSKEEEELRVEPQRLGRPWVQPIPHHFPSERVCLLRHHSCPRTELHVPCSPDQQLPKCVFYRLVYAGRTGGRRGVLSRTHCSAALASWECMTLQHCLKGTFPPEVRLGLRSYPMRACLWEIPSGHTAGGLMSSTVLAMSPFSPSHPPPFFFFAEPEANGKSVLR